MPANSRSVAAFDTSRGAGQVQFGFDTDVAFPAEPLVDLERRAQRQPVPRSPSDRCRREMAAGEAATARCGRARGVRGCLARAIEASTLERSQPAVNGLLMIERRAAAEVARVDERRRRPRLAASYAIGETIDTAAYHEHVVGASPASRSRSRERIAIAIAHAQTVFIL